MTDARVPLDVARGSFGDHSATVLAGAGAHVHEKVGRPHHLLVMLDDEHGVPDVA